MSDLNSKLPRGVDLPMPVGSDEAKIFSGPDSLQEREIWRQKLHDWKSEAIIRFSYDGKVYDDPDLSSKDSFNVALIWLWDELLFDFEAQRFTPKKLIEDSQKFGGLDGIILWHAYPVIGIDSRNQFDFYNEVPGLDKLIKEIQELGVKVYLNYNPWDRWTSRPIHSDQEELAQLVARYGFDGVFLDTMKSADPNFMAPILKVNPKIIVAGESRVQQERICDHVMSWAQWFADSEFPGVIRAKWFEPRHMLHQTRRWNRSHIEELHIAWLNGAGMLLWEVVFGSWVGWNQREIRMWKEMVAILRDHNDLIMTGVWEPLTKLDDLAEAHEIYASSFTKDDSTLYTIINKNAQSYSGPILDGVSGRIPGKGVAAIIRNANGVSLLNFSYDGLSDAFEERKPQRLNALRGILTEHAFTYRNRECGLYDGAPFVDAWKPLPPNYHQIFSGSEVAPVRLGALDEHEVTNSEFLEFMEDSMYRPKVAHRFLAHWVNGKPLENEMNLPVRYVDLDDALAYARWKGVEIPTEWEWQTYALEHKSRVSTLWNLTDSEHTDGRTRFQILKGGSQYSVRNGQGAKSTSGIAESDWYVDGGLKDPSWVEKLLVMGLGMNRSANISFTCFTLLRNS